MCILKEIKPVRAHRSWESLGSGPQIALRRENITLNKTEFIDTSTFLYCGGYILARPPGNGANGLLAWFYEA